MPFLYYYNTTNTKQRRPHINKIHYSVPSFSNKLDKTLRLENIFCVYSSLNIISTEIRLKQDYVNSTAKLQNASHL